MVTVILNIGITTFIVFHGVLRRFWSIRGTGTASFEAKLIHKLMAMRGEVMCAISMEMHKMYDALDRDRCLEILQGCGARRGLAVSSLPIATGLQWWLTQVTIMEINSKVFGG